MPRKLTLLCTGVIAAFAVFAAACDDDDAGDAEALGASYEDFTAALAGTTDISQATDDQKDALKDDCDELAGAVDNDEFDDLCDGLDDAVDDEDQVKFDSAKTAYASFDSVVRAAVGEEIGDAAGDDDRPLEGGDDANPDDNGNTDENDNNVDEDDIENPTDNE